MTSVSNISIGSALAGAAAAKSRHTMNESIARLATGKRMMYGGDAAAQSMAFSIHLLQKLYLRLPLLLYH